MVAPHRVPPTSHVRYGYRRDQKDGRDHIFSPASSRLPPVVDLRDHMPPVMDQGEIGSCTAHAITAALRFNLIKAGKPDVELSRLQLYYDERVIEGTIRSDAGAEIRNGIKSASKLGVGPEVRWPYDEKKFRRRPPKAVYTEGLTFQALAYQRVPVDVDAIKAALATGFPVVIGVTVYAGFESAEAEKTGVIPMPTPRDKPTGGHCMIATGYGQMPGHFTVRNSWSPSWGAAGDCYLPETYLGSSKFGSDYWLISAIG